jgi:hypothetical protein
MKPATGGTPAPNWPALTGDATPEGRRFWLTLVSEHGGTLTPASQVVLLKPPMAVADAASRSYRLLMLKAYFGMLSEARPWMSLTPAVSFEQMAAQRGSYEGPLLELHETLCELFRRHPDEKAVQWTWGWVHQNWLSPHAWPGAGSPHYDRIKREEVPDLLGVPRWAMLQNRLARSAAEVVNWWIERRRASNGEFGGTVNDDTCLMPWFLVPALVDSRLIEPARESSRGVMELAIRHGLDRGLCRRDTDYGHGYEDGINQTALMLAMDYGNPRYVEQAMLASRSLAQVTPMTPGGFRRFVPHDSRKEFGARLLDRPPPADPDWWKKPEPDNTTSAVNFHPMLLLAWYNRHPLAIRVLEEYGTGTEQWRRCGGYNSGPHFAFGLYWLTRRPEYMIARIEKGFRLNLDWDGAACDYVTHTPELRGHPDWPKARQAYGWDVLQLGWAVTQDRKVLERALEQSLWGRPGHWAAGGFDLFRHILTEAEMFDDRIFLYQNGLLGQTYLGGYMYRNKYWPSMAVSWDGLEEAFGALVLESGEERLKVAVVNLRETPRGGKMRAWQLRHGLYEVLTGPDENDDGVMDSVQSRETLELQRMDSAVNVELPPRKVMIYEARLVEALDRIEDRADPAIGPEDVVVRDDRIEATVHNLGIQPARQVRLALLDVQNVVLASAVVEDLEAPLDFIPRRKTVSFPRRG